MSESSDLSRDVLLLGVAEILHLNARKGRSRLKKQLQKAGTISQSASVEYLHKRCMMVMFPKGQMLRGHRAQSTACSGTHAARIDLHSCQLLLLIHKPRHVVLDSPSLVILL